MEHFCWAYPRYKRPVGASHPHTSCNVVTWQGPSRCRVDSFRLGVCKILGPVIKCPYMLKVPVRHLRGQPFISSLIWMGTILIVRIPLRSQASAAEPHPFDIARHCIPLAASNEVSEERAVIFRDPGDPNR